MRELILATVAWNSLYYLIFLKNKRIWNYKSSCPSVLPYTPSFIRYRINSIDCYTLYNMNTVLMFDWQSVWGNVTIFWFLSLVMKCFEMSLLQFSNLTEIYWAKVSISEKCMLWRCSDFIEENKSRCKVTQMNQQVYFRYSFSPVVERSRWLPIYIR